MKEVKIVKVENPVFLSYDEMEEKYWGKQVLVTNMESTTNPSKLIGGIVRYWGEGAMREIWRLLDKEFLDDDYGKRTVEFIGFVPFFRYAGCGES
jgi:hypothetical protein